MESILAISLQVLESSKQWAREQGEQLRLVSSVTKKFQEVS